MKYPALFSKSDGSFVVEFPGLGGCFTEGTSLHDATRNAVEALNAWLESNYERKLRVRLPEECLKIARRELRAGSKLKYIPADPVLSLAYLMRFSRRSNGDKTLSEVAQLMKMTQQNYSKTFESPKANPTLKTLSDALQELGYFMEINLIPKDQVFEGLDSPDFILQDFEMPELRKKKA